MYFVIVPLLTVVLPIVSILVEAHGWPAVGAILPLAGKWWVFWGIGIRLLIAGINQALRPLATSRDILGLDNAGHANILVRELGFANLCLGLIGSLSLVIPSGTVFAAIAGGLYLGLAGIGHVMTPKRNARESVAMITDFVVFAAAAIYLCAQAFR